MISALGYTFDDDRPIARITVAGHPSAEECTRLADSMFSDKRFRAGSGILVDRRQAEIPETAYVRQFIRYVDNKEASGESRGWAVVVADLGSYGMGRMAQTLSENENSVAVFREMEEAVVWLVAQSQKPLEPRQSIARRGAP